jgi:hypothetical protein
MSDRTDDDALIRNRAYELWQEAGMPDGNEDEFWHRARLEIEQEQKSVLPTPAENEPSAKITSQEETRSASQPKR